MSRYEFEIDRAAASRGLTGPRGALYVSLTRLLRRIRDNAANKAPVKTGNLARSGDAGRVEVTGPFRLRGDVTFTANYAAAVHDGIDAARIYPTKAKALRFRVGGRVVFAKSVVGNRPARPFLRNAADEEIARLRFTR